MFDVSAHLAGAADMKRRARRQFEDWAHTYDRSLLHHFLFRPSYLVFMEEIAAWHQRYRSPFRVLDIGCGTGELAMMLASSDWPVQVVGLDFAQSMCVKGREKILAAQLGHRARFSAGDSEFLPLADASFDVATCSNSFHHYPHQSAVVREVRRVLRPGGMFVLIDGFRDNVIGWVTFDVIIARIEGNVHHLPWSAIDRYFREAGFQRIRRRKFNVWMPLCATIGEV